MHKLIVISVIINFYKIFLKRETNKKEREGGKREEKLLSNNVLRNYLSYILVAVLNIKE